MEAWQVIFRNLYTGFLLRDFAGKIVPGIILLFSIAAMFRPPGEIFSRVKRNVPIFAIVFLAGFAWTVTLGTQSLAEGLGIWKYFSEAPSKPPKTPKVGFWKDLVSGGDESDFEANTAMVDKFQQGANEDEKQQYERFVVIKEACGNLFIAGLFAIPAWLIVVLRMRILDREPPQLKWKQIFRTVFSGSFWGRWLHHAGAPVLGCLYFVLIMIGLHRMNAQHVHRQTRFAEIVLQNKNSADAKNSQGSNNPPNTKTPNGR